MNNIFILPCGDAALLNSMIQSYTPKFRLSRILRRIMKFRYIDFLSRAIRMVYISQPREIVFELGLADKQNAIACGYPQAIAFEPLYNYIFVY